MSAHTMRPLGEIYRQANEELLVPAPSIRLPDWNFFNEATGGLRAHEYTVLCGPTGSGKTTWLSNLSTQLLLRRSPHFVASVETGATDYIKRVMSVLSQQDLNSGDPVALSKLQNINREYGKILTSNDIWLSLYESKVDAEQLCQDIAYAHKTHGCTVAILDNMNYFLEVSRAADQMIELDKATRVFIDFVKKTPVHIVMVMHPRKTDGGRVETEFDIKGSSTAVQEAYNVLLFNRTRLDEQAQFPMANYRELKIAKMRRRGKYVYRRIIYKNMEGFYSEERFL